MNSGIPSANDDRSTKWSTITEFCGADLAWCESCSTLDGSLEVTLRPTRDGRSTCLVECTRCAAAPGFYDRASAGRFADDHQRHLTRAADMVDPRREEP